MREREEALGEEQLRVVGRDEAIGDHVVDESRAHRAQIAEPQS
jgi:hypothetical protein